MSNITFFGSTDGNVRTVFYNVDGGLVKDEYHEEFGITVVNSRKVNEVTNSSILDAEEDVPFFSKCNGNYLDYYQKTLIVDKLSLGYTSSKLMEHLRDSVLQEYTEFSSVRELEETFGVTVNEDVEFSKFLNLVKGISNKSNLEKLEEMRSNYLRQTDAASKVYECKYLLQKDPVALMQRLDLLQMLLSFHNKFLNAEVE